MPYDALEESHQQGEPREVYDFIRGAVNIGRYTSADVAVTIGADTYSPWPGGMKRGPVNIATDSGRNTFRVTVARTHPIAVRMRERPRAGVIGIRVRRFHVADASDIVLVFSGRVLSARNVGVDRELISESRAVATKRRGLREIHSANCQWALYEANRCRIDPESVRHDTTIVSVTGRVLEVADVDPAFSYAGGFVKWIEAGTGIPEYAYVEAQDGELLTLDWPIFGAAALDDVALYPGCDHTLATCHTVFGNQENHGGRPLIAKKNPFTQNSFA